MLMASKRQIGAEYEEMAAAYLERNGYRILERNVHSRHGEIDIVAIDGGYLVFIEIKYRKDAAFGDPLEAVDAKKQRRICRTASYFCMRGGYSEDTPCRFDVVAVLGKSRIEHIKNAFEYQL